MAADTGWVSVGTDHDAAEFAVATIGRWWTTAGSDPYPGATALLICADGGGSNGYRTRLWKTELAARTGLQVTDCHLPPRTSKWNKIDTPALLPDLDELARTTPDQPRGDR